jgi:hypothetical protein
MSVAKTCTFMSVAKTCVFMTVTTGRRIRGEKTSAGRTAR